MGIYLNPNNDNYREIVNSNIFIDKSLLIEKTNEIVGCKDCKLCVTRPRRFGKTTDADMLVTYYSKGNNAADVFDELNISNDALYKKHLNKHNVIFLNMQDFLSLSQTTEELIKRISKFIMIELKKEFPDVYYYLDSELSFSLLNINDQTGQKK